MDRTGASGTSADAIRPGRAIDGRLAGQQDAAMRNPARVLGATSGGSAVSAPPAGAHGSPAAVDWHVLDALTDIYAYALALEAETQRRAGRPDDSLVREELEALRNTITALRATVDPVAAQI